MAHAHYAAYHCELRGHALVEFPPSSPPRLDLRELCPAALCTHTTVAVILRTLVLYRNFVCGGGIYKYEAWTGGRILRLNWDKSLESFPPRHSRSPLPAGFTTPPPPLLSKSSLKLICNVNIVSRNLKPENSQDYAQKPQQNCTFMNSAPGLTVSCRLDNDVNGLKECSS